MKQAVMLDHLSKARPPVIDIARSPRFRTLSILVFVFFVIIFKLSTEQYIFDPNYGAHSVYGFAVSDPKVPFTVFYINEGADFAVAQGDFRILNHTLQIGGSTDASVEWIFTIQPFLDIVKRNGGQIETAAFMIASHPFSSINNTYVSIYINDQLAVNTSLSNRFEDKYTWEVTTVWDIPGSNFGYPYDFAVFSIPRESMPLDTSDSGLVRVRIATSEDLHWDVNYAVLKLFSDPYLLKSPWWRQNLSSISAAYVVGSLAILSIAFLRIELKRGSSQLSIIDAVKHRISSGKFILLCIVACLLFRLTLAVIMSFPGSIPYGDQLTYRFIGIASYYYGIDARSFFGLYGTVWHGLILILYPIALVLSPYATSFALDYVVLRVPAIVSDILVGLLLYRIGGKLAGQKTAGILLAFWIFNPYVIWLSTLWGTHHLIPTMLVVLAAERIIYGHYKSSALALSAAVFSGLNNVFLLPIFLLLAHRSLEKPRRGEFLSFFILGSSAFALPWNFSIAILFNTYSGAGRAGFPTLSYSYFLVPIWLQGLWSSATLLLGLTVLYIYIIKKKGISVPQILDLILIAFLIFYLTNTTVFPTYALWALPFLLVAYLLSRKVSFPYILSFMSFPFLWILYWSLPFGSSIPQLPSNEVFRDTFGLNFSFVCLLLLGKMILANNEPQATASQNRIGKPLLGLTSPQLTMKIAFVSLVLFVFAPWIKEPLWLTAWESTIRPSLFVLIVSLLSFSFILNRPKTGHTGNIGIKRLQKDQLAAVSAIVVTWLYNAMVLAFAAILPFVLHLPSVLLQSDGDLYFSLISLLWLPLVASLFMKNRKTLSFAPWIVLLQIDYIITRHYNTYTTLSPVLGTYVIKDAITFMIDISAIALMLTFVLLAVYYERARLPQELATK